MKNLGLKLFSVLIAVGLSYYVNSETNVSVIGFSVPVEIKNVPEDKMLVWPLSPKAQITVKGPSYLVSQVATSKLTFQVRVPASVTNNFRAALDRAELSVPASVEVMSIEPAEVNLTFDKKLVKEFPVVIPRFGNLPEGIQLEKIKVTPNTITLTGPESELKGIRTIETEPIDIREIRESTNRVLKVRLPGNLTKASEESVQLRIEVSSIDKERRFKAVPLELRAPSNMNYTIEPNNVSVEISGTIDVIQKLKKRTVVPFVKFGDDVAKGDKLPVSVELPEGVSLVLLEPENVTVTAISPKENPAVKK
ncbi:MAG: hypothetical protein H6619_05325 [Deltaproteobacteria bacterium]|nr:hypothetical protein [Deltaproteobacteria bacterium]